MSDKTPKAGLYGIPVHKEIDGEHYVLKSYSDKIITEHEAVEKRLRREVEEALEVLDPSMPENGLVDACRQVKQVAISQAGNVKTANQRIEELEEVEKNDFLKIKELEGALRQYDMTLEHIERVCQFDNGDRTIKAICRTARERRSKHARLIGGEDGDTCEHEWVDARNEVITSGQFCTKCHAVRPDQSIQQGK